MDQRKEKEICTKSWNQNNNYSFEEAYKLLKPELIRYAKSKLIQKEESEDAVSDAFISVLKYGQSRKTFESSRKNVKISKFILYKKVQRECFKRNKKTIKEISIESLKEIDQGFTEFENVDSWYNDGSFGFGSD